MVFLNLSFFKTIVFIKLVVSLKIVNDDPSLTIVNDNPLLTKTRKPTCRASVLIIEYFLRQYQEVSDPQLLNFMLTIVYIILIFFFQKRSFKKKRSQIVFIKTFIFKGDRYSFSKCLKQVSNFLKLSFFSENETIVFENVNLKKV